MQSILVVDDDPAVRSSLARALASDETDVEVAESGEAALARLDKAPDLVLADLKMPGMDGIELLQALSKKVPATDVVIMTAHDDLPTVATAMREGARDFLTKPLDLHHLRRLVERILADRSLRAETESNDAEAEAEPGHEKRLIGRDPRLVEIFKIIGRVATSRATVLIRGESGTGKELIAREIHGGSTRADEPFVAVDCTSIPATLLESELFGHVRGAFTGATRDREGRFQLAGHGTIFLDEIGDTSAEFQAKLLRVLQEHECVPVGSDHAKSTNCRVIAATHRDLEAMVEAAEFRGDLYYRLRIVEITVPPLRERRTDLPDLIEHFLARASVDVDRKPPLLSDEAREKLLAYAWPGNVRELENCIARATVMCSGDVIQESDLVLTKDAAPIEADLSLNEIEKLHVARVLERTGGHKARTAGILEISRPRLDRLIEKHGLEPLLRKGNPTDPAGSL